MFNQLTLGYHSHLKWLISTAGEMIEWCSNNTSEMDDATSLADLIEQLERKRTILVNLDKQISLASVMMIWKLKYSSQKKYNVNSLQQ